MAELPRCNRRTSRWK